MICMVELELAVFINHFCSAPMGAASLHTAGRNKMHLSHIL